MNNALRNIRPGLFLALLTLLFGIVMGISFGANEAGYEHWIAQEIALHPTLHDADSPEKIWRYAQRAHFHATGIGAFSLGLMLLVGLTGMRARMKTICSTLIGLSGFYPLGWLSIFMLAPSMGREPAHEAAITQVLVYVGVIGLLSGLLILALHLLFDMWKE
ncbi:MAG: hypothetical protein Q7S51_07930 [Gallionellaceae bacterium]|nr:hypothetical protein [Gallionellaceae bacterium]